MGIIKLSDVSFEYEAYDENEEIETSSKKNKNKKNASDEAVFKEFAEIRPIEEKDARGDADKVRALSHVSFEIDAGEYIALVGRNGSGKSTLAKLFNGLFLPTEGDVLINGLNTKDKKNLFEIRKNVGMVFQNPDNQMIASIVEDDIAFGPENIGLPPAEIRERVDWALDAVGMSEYRNSTPFKLSGGQKQRIAIAGMLAIKPRVLVLDESTAMLDPKGRREVMEVVRKLNEEEGITIVNITHYMDETLAAKRVIVLDGGSVMIDASPKEVFAHRRQLEKLGLAVPNLLMIEDKLRERGIEIQGDSFTIKELVTKIWQLSQKN